MNHSDKLGMLVLIGMVCFYAIRLVVTSISNWIDYKKGKYDP